MDAIVEKIIRKTIEEYKKEQIGQYTVGTILDFASHLKEGEKLAIISEKDKLPDGAVYTYELKRENWRRTLEVLNG